MALEINDLMALQSMDKSSMTPYEQYKVGYMQQKHHTSGIGVAGLVLGTVGTAAAVGAWIFGPMYGNAKANQAREVANSAKELANVQIAASQRQIGCLISLHAPGSQGGRRRCKDRHNGTVIADQCHSISEGL